MNEADPRKFQTTHWTLVLSARGETPAAKAALRDLCEAYYAPVENFVRSYRPGRDDARDLTHAFFAKILEGQSLAGVDRVEGRFRSYLLGAVKHFLADVRDRDLAERRGGGRMHESLDLSTIDLADPRGFPPDAYFDRQWAITLVDQAITELRVEAESVENARRFETLLPWLLANGGGTEMSTAAQALELTEGTFKVAVHRLRKRFRKIVLARVSATVDETTSIEAELGYLIAAMTAKIG